MPESNLKPKPKQIRERENRSFLQYGGMGLQLLTTIAVFAFGGRYLDVQLGWKFPVLTLVLTLVGVFGGMYLVLRKL